MSNILHTVTLTFKSGHVIVETLPTFSKALAFCFSFVGRTEVETLSIVNSLYAENDKFIKENAEPYYEYGGGL
jgi:hypothetical protein